MADPVETTEKNVDLFESEDGTFLKLNEEGRLVPYKGPSERERRQRHLHALSVATLGTAGEIGQFFVQKQILNDPVIEDSRKELAALEAKASEPIKGLSDAEKVSFRNSVINQVKRTNDAITDRAQDIASSMGENSARVFLESAKMASNNMASAAIQTEARIGELDLDKREQQRLDRERSKEAAKQIKAMLLRLREERIREPIHAMIGNFVKNTTKVIASAPVSSHQAEINEAINQGANAEDIKKLESLSNKPFAKARMKAEIKKIIKRRIEKDPTYIAGLSSEDRERLEAQGLLDDADTASELSKFARGSTDGQTPEVDAITASSEVPDFDIDDSDMTVAERRQMAGLKGEVSPAEQQQLMRNALGSIYKYKKPDLISSRTLPNSYEKGQYTYVYDTSRSVWQVFEDGKKLDYELPIAKAAVSIVPGEMELYALARSEGLLSDDNTLQANMTP